MESEKDKIEHFECSACNKQITEIIDDEVTSETHFDISRSKKQFSLDGSEIVEDETERNTKMLHFLCESCFLKVLNESTTLGKLFLDRKGKLSGEECFIY